MKVHPLFAGFKGASPHAVGAALGFAVHVETYRGALPEALPVDHQPRLQEGGDLFGFRFAGGWEAPGAHCLMFAKPLTMMAASWWFVGEGEQAVKACTSCGHWQRALPSVDTLARLQKHDEMQALAASLPGGALAP